MTFTPPRGTGATTTRSVRSRNRRRQNAATDPRHAAAGQPELSPPRRRPGRHAAAEPDTPGPFPDGATSPYASTEPDNPGRFTEAPHGAASPYAAAAEELGEGRFGSGVDGRPYPGESFAAGGAAISDVEFPAPAWDPWAAAGDKLPAASITDPMEGSGVVDSRAFWSGPAATPPGYQPGPSAETAGSPPGTDERSGIVDSRAFWSGPAATPPGYRPGLSAETADFPPADENPEDAGPESRWHQAGTSRGDGVKTWAQPTGSATTSGWSPAIGSGDHPAGAWAWPPLPDTGSEPWAGTPHAPAEANATPAMWAGQDAPAAWTGNAEPALAAGEAPPATWAEGADSTDWATDADPTAWPGDAKPTTWTGDAEPVAWAGGSDAAAWTGDADPAPRAASSTSTAWAGHTQPAALAADTEPAAWAADNNAAAWAADTTSTAWAGNAGPAAFAADGEPADWTTGPASTAWAGNAGSAAPAAWTGEPASTGCAGRAADGGGAVAWGEGPPGMAESGPAEESWAVDERERVAGWGGGDGVSAEWDALVESDASFSRTGARTAYREGRGEEEQREEGRRRSGRGAHGRRARSRYLSAALVRCGLYLGPLSAAVAGAEPLGRVAWPVPAVMFLLGWTAAQGLTCVGVSVARRGGPSAAARIVGAGFAGVIGLWFALVWIAPDGLLGPDRALAATVGLGGLITLGSVTAALVTRAEGVVAGWFTPCWLLAAATMAGYAGIPQAALVPVETLLPAAIVAVAVRAFRPAVLGGRALPGGLRLGVDDRRRCVAYLVVGAAQATSVALLWRGGPGVMPVPAALPLLVAVPLLEALIGWHTARLDAGLDSAETPEEFDRHVRNVTAITLAGLVPPLAAGCGLLVAAFRLPYGFSGVPGARDAVLALAAGTLLGGVFAVTFLLAARSRHGIAAVLATIPPLAAAVLALFAPPAGLLPAAVAVLAATHLAGLLIVALTAADLRRTP